MNIEELGDRRRLQLLHRMSQLLGNHGEDVNDPRLWQLFLQCLPKDMALVLAACACMKYDQLAKSADRIAEYFLSKNIATVADTSYTSRDDSRLGRRESRSDEIRHRLS